MKTAATATVFGALAATVAAHGAVTSFSIDGKEQRGYHISDYYAIEQGQPAPETAGWYAENLDNGFIAPDAYGTSDIACHKNGKPSKTSAKIAAGGKLEWHWDTWPASHVGPVLTYVAKCDGDCADADPASLKFVKIDEAGYNSETKKWAADELIANGNSWSHTIPAGLAPGNYVARHEIIALHGANDPNGAQNYPQCINIEITGSGSDSPEGTLATDLYKADDAGIRFNPYVAITKYEIPGPKLYTSGSGSPTTPAPTEPSAPATTPAPAEPSTPAPAEPSTPAEGEDEGEDDTCEADEEDEEEDEEDDTCEADEEEEEEEEGEGEDDTCEAEEEEEEEGQETVSPVEVPEEEEEDPECEDDAADRAPRQHARDFTTSV
jgi:cellulase